MRVVRLTRLAAIVIAGVLSVALSACGGTATTVKTTTTNPTSITKSTLDSSPGPAPAPSGRTQSTSAASANGEASPEPRTVPNETGVRLGVAARALQGKALSFKVVGRSGSAVAGKSTWTVCASNPLPNTHLEPGTTIYLTVAPSCR
jgi:hypothetical protein